MEINRVGYLRRTVIVGVGTPGGGVVVAVVGGVFAGGQGGL